MKWLDSITNTMGVNLSKLQEMVQDRVAWHAAFHGVTKSQTDLVIEHQQQGHSQFWTENFKGSVS